MVPCFLMAALPESATQEGRSQEELTTNPKQLAVEDLPLDQQQVYHQLGPLYQRIYLYALNDEERHRVVVYTRRGLSNFEAINTILRNEERRYDNPNENKSIAPSDRTAKNSSCPPRSIF